LLVTDVLPFFRDLGHLLITVGDRFDKSGGEIAKALLDARFDRFHQGLLKLA
jgi:hypothetical protein